MPSCPPPCSTVLRVLGSQSSPISLLGLPGYHLFSTCSVKEQEQKQHKEQKQDKEQEQKQHKEQEQHKEQKQGKEQEQKQHKEQEQHKEREKR